VTRQRDVAVVGWGHSNLVTGGPFDITEAAERAIGSALDSAGVGIDRVDGLSTYARPAFPVERQDGVNAAGVVTVLKRFRFPAITWFCVTETGMAEASIVVAVHAIQSGACDVVVVWRAMALSLGRYGASAPRNGAGDAAYTAPYGATALLPWHGLAYSRYRASASGLEADLGCFVVDAHRLGLANPAAASLKRPGSVEEYLASPYVSDPLRRLDCDRPVGGAGAIVLAARSTRPASERLAVIAGVAQNVPRENSHVHPALGDHYVRGRALANRLWDSTGESPASVSVAQLYDGFAPTAFYWMEALGFCDRGEAGGWYCDPARRMPINTFGGSLGEGRLHGVGHVIEAARQVSNRAGERQIPGCRSAVVTIGSPLVDGGAFVLRAE
jgi:acetyl-CoA acetyltransferase